MGGGQGLFETPIEGVRLIRCLQHRVPSPEIQGPSLWIVLQGATRIEHGGETLACGAMQCVVVAAEPSNSERIVIAGATEPLVAVTVEFDVAMIRDLLEHMETLPVRLPGGCVVVAGVDEPLAECIRRLIRMLGNPKSVPILYPSIMREICYWLLNSPHGGQLRKLALPETQMERVAKALHHLRDNFQRTMRVEELASAARMSPSSFHFHFKALTSMTPLQFQKRLRLVEARRLMVTNAVNVGEAAYQVGYESASQFSREYSRMFGTAPKRDVMSIRAAST